MKKVSVLAYYLPQYHPIKENNEWYGKGFTEWTNVAKAKPLFKGHEQPNIPADLGFYDLRLSEVREEQVILAKEAGIDAFCYWHYWFGNGRQLLEFPLNEILRLGKPNFPFCLAWANHTWYSKMWNNDKKVLYERTLIEQCYPGREDIISHFMKMLPAFQDYRYYKVDGKLLFIIYAPKELPDFKEFRNIWSELAEKNGLPGFYFVAQSSDIDDVKKDRLKEFDAINLSLLNEPWSGKNSILKKGKRMLQEKLSFIFNRPLNVLEYSKVINGLVCDYFKIENVYPTIVPRWDNTPRRSNGGQVFLHPTPFLFKKQVAKVLDMIKDKKEPHRIIFLKSWNEWAEGNYMEPDLKYGKGFINALREILKEYENLSD